MTLKKLIVGVFFKILELADDFVFDEFCKIGIQERPIFIPKFNCARRFVKSSCVLIVRPISNLIIELPYRSF